MAGQTSPVNPKSDLRREKALDQLLNRKRFPEACHGVRPARELSQDVVEGAPVAVLARVRDVGELVAPVAAVAGSEPVPVVEPVGARLAPDRVLDPVGTPAADGCGDGDGNAAAIQQGRQMGLGPAAVRPVRVAQRDAGRSRLAEQALRQEGVVCTACSIQGSRLTVAN